VADLLFSFQEILDEIDAMSRIAENLLTDETCQTVLPRFYAVLESIRAKRPTAPVACTIKNPPIRTIVSHGEYEQQPREGEHKVFAEITTIWEILCPPEKGPKKQQQKHFQLCGIGSTKVRILKTDDSGTQELAMWRCEIGNEPAPGCHFHSQVEGERTAPPYPKSLSVPRLPTILVTPMAVLEFVLAELFQSRWKEHALQETAYMQRWRPIQKRRLQNLLRWQSGCLENGTGSPWTSFKMQKPDANLFVRGG
jgi:hypothetical protein